MKTAKEIQDDVWRLLQDSILADELSGGMYKAGYRPRDSRKEDAIVKYTTGISDQIQEGIVTINIFVPDIDPYNDGVMVEDGNRTTQIERMAQDWVDQIATEVSDYDISLSEPIYTEDEPDIDQHFVVVRLNYRLLTD